MTYRLDLVSSQRQTSQMRRKHQDPLSFLFSKTSPRGARSVSYRYRCSVIMAQPTDQAMKKGKAGLTRTPSVQQLGPGHGL